MPFQKGHKRFGGMRLGQRTSKTADRHLVEAEGRARLRARTELPPEDVAALSPAVLTPDDIAALSPLAVMLTLMRAALAENNRDLALKCAGLAAPFVHPRLNASELKISHDLANLSDGELLQEANKLRERLTIEHDSGAHPLTN